MTDFKIGDTIRSYSYKGVIVSLDGEYAMFEVKEGEGYSYDYCKGLAGNGSFAEVVRRLKNPKPGDIYHYSDTGNFRLLKRGCNQRITKKYI